LIRIEAEIQMWKLSGKEYNDMANAAAYFNFLLERPGESPIEWIPFLLFLNFRIL
jgi:hypothetical protein